MNDWLNQTIQSKNPVPNVPFEIFYNKFETVKDILDTPDWQDIYSSYYDFNKFELEVNIHENLDKINDYTPEKQRQEIIKCIQSFDYFCTKYVKIIHPVHGLIPFISYKYQRRVISDYTKNKFNIISKFRQGGLTTLTVIWGLWRCLFKTDQQIMVMSKTDREAVNAGEIVDQALDEIPEWMFKSRRGGSGKAKHKKRFRETGSSMSFFTPEAARSKSITFLVIDEAAFIEHMDKHWKAIYPVISTGGACSVISTVNGRGNWYHEWYIKSVNRKTEFNVIDLDYWEHPSYNDPVWIKKTKANLGEKGWLQEVERSFLGSGETFIPQEIIGKIETETRDRKPIFTTLEKWENRRSEDRESDNRGALWIWEKPIEGHEYLISADCAEGVEDGDNSCFEIIDMGELKQVAEFYSNLVPPHIFAQIIEQYGIYYNNALVVVENMGIGNAVIKMLEADLNYQNLYYDHHSRKNKAGIRINQNNRQLFLEALQHRLLTGRLEINSARFANELGTLIFSPGTRKVAAQKGCHDDAIMAMAMGVYIRDDNVRDLPFGAEIPKDSLEIIKSDTYAEIRREILEELDGELNFMPNPYVISREDYLDDRPKRPHDTLLKEFGW